MLSDKAIKSGYRDYLAGVPFDRNPMKYGPNAILSAYWEKGWQQAKDEQEKRK